MLRTASSRVCFPRSRAFSSWDLQYTYTNHYINGAWTDSQGKGSIEVIDSNTATVMGMVPAGSAGDMNAACDAAAAAFPSWSATPLSQRKEALIAIMAQYEKRIPEVNAVLMQELGCTRSFAEQVQSGLPLFHWGELLKKIDDFQWEEEIPPNTVLVKEPIGVVGCITPWNYPLNQIALKIGPAILAGCTVALKPSEVTPISAYILAEAIHDSGALPAGVFNMVVGYGEEVGEAMSAQ